MPTAKSTDLVIVRLGAARVALREAKTIQDKKKLVDVSDALKVFAKRQGASEEVKAEAASFHVDTMLLLGQALDAMDKNTGAKGIGTSAVPKMNHTHVPTLAELGIEKKTSMIAQKIAKLSPAKLQVLRVATSAMSAALAEAEGHNHRAQGTGENEWYTPSDHIEAARGFMGAIDLDPASSVKAQAVVRATKFYTQADDGLKHEWRGRVWLNPPYAQPAIQQFAQKMVDEVRAGRVSEAVMLTHNYTDTEWFHIAESACTSICFTRGRIAFLDPEGKKAAPTQGQVFFYYGRHPDEFAVAYRQYGFIVRPT